MIKLILPLLLLALTLHARENPFFPTEGMQEMPITASSADTFSPLKRAAIALPDSARVLKEVQVTFQNLDGSIATRTINLDHSIDWHLPLFISQSYNATKSESTAPAPSTPQKASTPLVDFGPISFSQSEKQLKVHTQDPMIRHFMLVNPHRVVMDFKRDASFRSKLHTIAKGKPYTAIRLGNHAGYYRAVIELDGQYRYTVDQSNGTLQITCY